MKAPIQTRSTSQSIRERAGHHGMQQNLGRARRKLQNFLPRIGASASPTEKPSNSPTRI
jgi:hypothetical protein